MNHIEAFNHPAVLEIPVDTESEHFDTHSTGGEHANKESGAWQDYFYDLKRSGGSLPAVDELKVDDFGIAHHPDDDDPDNPYGHYFHYYLSMGPGRFYRAYQYDGGRTMWAGMTHSPTEDRGLRVDSMYCPNPLELAVTPQHESVANQLTASALYEILTKVFDNYSGSYGMPTARYLDFPLENIRNALQPQPESQPHWYHPGLLRGLHDFAIATQAGFRIPLPGLVTRDFEGLDETSLEELKQPMPENFTGALRYSLAADPDVFIEEHYRNKTPIGALVSTYNEATYSSTLEARDADGQVLDFKNLVRDKATRRVKFLKLLAENSKTAAELILA